jgi:hypothetical protein
MVNPKITLLATSLFLVACGGGGGGGGGGNDSPSQPSTPAPSTGGDNGTVTPPTAEVSPPASKATMGTISGYTYVNPMGTEYKLRQSGIIVTGQTNWILGKGSTSWCCGKMSYTTYGTWVSPDNDDRAVFYTGEPTATANVPTQGTATYVGEGMRGMERSAASFNVDFGAKSINGNIDGSDKFGSAIAMQGKIVDGGFTGAAQSGGQDGTFVGHFNGPAAQELGGIAEFADTSKSASFGATAQQ